MTTNTDQTDTTTTELGHDVRIVKHPSGCIILEAPELNRVADYDQIDEDGNVTVEKSARAALIDQTVRELIDMHGLRLDDLGWTDAVRGRQALIFHP